MEVYPWQIEFCFFHFFASAERLILISGWNARGPFVCNLTHSFFSGLLQYLYTTTTFPGCSFCYLQGCFFNLVLNLTPGTGITPNKNKILTRNTKGQISQLIYKLPLIKLASTCTIHASVVPASKTPYHICKCAIYARKINKSTHFASYFISDCRCIFVCYTVVKLKNLIIKHAKTRLNMHASTK